jgi:hypothetical protein
MSNNPTTFAIVGIPGNISFAQKGLFLKKNSLIPAKKNTKKPTNIIITYKNLKGKINE